MRDGHTSPYIYGPNLGLRSNIVKDALLQRLGCLPVCKAAAVQYLLQLLNEVAPVSGDDGGATPSRTNLRSIANLAGQLRKWLSAGDAEQPGGCPSLQQLVSELQRRVGRDTHGQVVSDELIARTLKMMKKLKTAEPVRAQIDPEDWVTAVERVCVAVRDLHSEFHLGKRAAIVNQNQLDIFIQGAGDLSFNEWNVAYIRGGQNGVESRTLIPEGEPYSRRRYRCIVK